MRRVWLAWIAVVVLMMGVAVLWRWRGRSVSVARVAERLSDPKRAVRLETAESLGKVAAPSSVPAMVARLPVEPEAEVRQALCVAIAQAGTPEGDAVVRARLADPSRGVRLETVKAFTNVPVRGAVAMLAERLPSEQDAELRDAVCFALGRAGNHEAAKALATLLDDADAGIADRARRVLEAIYHHPLPPDAAAARSLIASTPPPA